MTPVHRYAASAAPLRAVGARPAATAFDSAPSRPEALLPALGAEILAAFVRCRTQLRRGIYTGSASSNQFSHAGEAVRFVADGSEIAGAFPP